MNEFEKQMISILDRLDQTLEKSNKDLNASIEKSSQQLNASIEKSSQELHASIEKSKQSELLPLRFAIDGDVSK
jgi:hypothetical protein